MIFLSPNDIGTDVYINLDDFGFDFGILINNEPAAFQLISPSNESQLLDSSEIQFNWSQSNDVDNDTVNYEFKIWTESVIDNYLINPSLDSVTTHCLEQIYLGNGTFGPIIFIMFLLILNCQKIQL